MPAKEVKTATEVILYWPNIIGYLRFVLILVTFWYMSTNYIFATITFIANILLDCVDGRVARHFDQCSKYGELLDIVLDRFGNVGFIIQISQYFPDYTFFMQLWAFNEFAASWVHLHASTLMGYKFTSGKEKNHLILAWAYTEPIFSIWWFGSELFFILLYLLHFTEGSIVPGTNVGLIRLSFMAMLPIFVVRTLIGFAQIVSATIRLAKFDAKAKQ